MVIWERIGEAYRATLATALGNDGFHLVAVPSYNRWDWAVWRHGDRPEKPHQGVLFTVQDAMRDAELVTLVWGSR
jgi:hypothetical protein